MATLMIKITVLTLTKRNEEESRRSDREQTRRGNEETSSPMNVPIVYSVESCKQNQCNSSEDAEKDGEHTWTRASRRKTNNPISHSCHLSLHPILPS